MEVYNKLKPSGYNRFGQSLQVLFTVIAVRAVSRRGFGLALPPLRFRLSLVFDDLKLLRAMP